LFLAEKQIEGVGGCELTELMRYVIAFQACLLILNLGIEAYDGWTSIYVYPDSSVDRREREFMSEEPMAGAAMQGGAVALSWEAVLYGSNRDRDGFNPVYHAFVLLGAMPSVPAATPWGQLWLDTTSALVLDAGSFGSGRHRRTTVPVPSLPALRGLPLAVQALVRGRTDRLSTPAVIALQ